MTIKKKRSLTYIKPNLLKNGLSTVVVYFIQTHINRSQLGRTPSMAGWGRHKHVFAKDPIRYEEQYQQKHFVSLAVRRLQSHKWPTYILFAMPLIGISLPLMQRWCPAVHIIIPACWYLELLCNSLHITYVILYYLEGPGKQ